MTIQIIFYKIPPLGQKLSSRGTDGGQNGWKSANIEVKNQKSAKTDKKNCLKLCDLRAIFADGMLFFAKKSLSHAGNISRWKSVSYNEKVEIG